MTETVVIGRIGSPYGVKGWSHIQSYTDPVENILTYQPWRIAAPGSSNWRELDAVVKTHREGFIAKIADDRDRAGMLRGFLLGVDVARLPEPAENEVYWRDLIGCEVVIRSVAEGCVQTDGAPPETSIGAVRDIIATGANDVLVVGSRDGDVLIPFVEPYVVTVDTSARRIVVDWREEWR